MAAFTSGNLVVYRVGTGTGSLVNTGNAVFLDEFTPSGVLVQSIALPTSDSGANHALIASGTAASEGLLTLSADAQHLLLTGYDATPGGSANLGNTNASSIPRVVGIVDNAGNIDTSTALTDAATANNVRGAASPNGTDLYVTGGAGGVRYTLFDGDAATDTSTQLTSGSPVVNFRAVEIFNGQLYVSSNSGNLRLGTVGTGAPTTGGQIILSLPGFPNTGSPYGFYFADLTPAVAGLDTLYVAEDTTGGGQVQKYSLVGGSWTANGSIADAAVRGLTASVSGTSVTLFTTTGGGGATGGGSLDTFTDTSGYNATITGTLTHLASAVTNEAFRGVAFTPVAAIVPAQLSIAATGASKAEGNSGTTPFTFTVTRANDATSATSVHYAVTGSGANPADAGDFVGGALPAGDVSLAAGQTSATVTINVAGDTAIEPTETFTVTLSGPTGGAMLGTATATGTIQADDAADTTQPTLASATPVDNAGNVAIGANVVLTFSESVQAVAGRTITITNGSDDVRTISVTDPQVTIANNVVTINPTADLRPGTTYDVIVPGGAFADAAGNAFAGIAQDALDFTTSSAIPPGTQATTFTISSPGTFTLAAGATRTQTAGTGVQASVSSGATTIDIEGTLNDTASGARAIRAGLVNGQILVGPNALIQALDGDAIQEQALGGGALSTVNVTNLGQIISASSITTISSSGATPPAAAYALNFNAAVGAVGAPATDFTSGGIITNGSATNAIALIRSDSGDAIRLGAHETLVNYGTIDGNAPINDSSTNNSFNGTSTAQRYDISRGVRINAATSTNDTIENHGRIEGAQHGVDVGNTAATNIVVTNAAGAIILGHNGSGVGADTTGAAATTVTVTNSGTIRGEYAPNYDRAGLATLDGDGDGVDIDGGATVINLAGGLIAGSGASGNLGGQGAGGFDSAGRANRSEGLSLGGGVVLNDGTISGADSGVVVNNDANPDNSRSGVLATTITNDATGLIVGQNGYAIRLENKTGTASVDNDTITNYGAITGNGTIPDPNGTVLREDGLADPGTVGTLNAVAYTSANAGNARFISGDGSAIQTGEGADTVSNYGTITGNTGRAISLEGGADTLTLHTGGTVAGHIDGGAGIDALILALDDRTGGDARGANSGVTTGTISDVAGFETLGIQGGTWTVSDAQTYSGGATISAGAVLRLGAGGSLAASLADGGVFAIDHADTLVLSGPVSGSGVLQQLGAGTTILSVADTYTGGTQLYDGTLDIAVQGAAGTGTITFEAGAQTLRVESAALSANDLSNVVAGFTIGDTIDIRGIGTATSATLGPGHVLTIAGGTGGDVTLHLDPAQNYSDDLFQVASDGNGGTNVTLAPDTRPSLTLHLSEDAYQGNAQFVVTVDGQQIGSVQEATALHAAGQAQDITLHGDFGPSPNRVVVQFVNDFFGGSADQDRNLYVDSLAFNGHVYQGEEAANTGGYHTSREAVLITNGTLTFDTSPEQSLTLHVSEDAYQGNAQFVVLVDGQQVGGVQEASASHSASQAQNITVSGHFAAAPNSVAVQFVNDLYGGAPDQDRNLYVDSLALNGHVYQGEEASNTAGYNTAGEAVMITNGTLTFDTSPQQSLTLHVSQDAYQGNAQFIVKVDGQQVGGVQEASASHAASQAQEITVSGHFAAAPNSVTVQFVNDLYGGAPDHDRNLYVDSLALNGHVYQGEAADNAAGYNTASEAVMITNGALTFDTHLMV